MTGQGGGMSGGTRLAIFVNVVLICFLGALLAVALIWVVGRWSFKHDLRVDLTRDARFSMDPLGEAVVRRLEEPVRATFVYGIDDEIKKRAVDLAGQPRWDVLDQYYRPLVLKAAARIQVILLEWSKLSEKFTFEAIDADTNPHRMAEVARATGRTVQEVARGINQVVFEKGVVKRSIPLGRMFPINWGYVAPDPRAPSALPELIGTPHPQSELVEALRAIAAGEAVKVGLPRGMSAGIPSEGAEFVALKSFLASQGFEAAPFDLARGVPEDVKLIALLGPGRRLLPEEDAELTKFESSGGRLLLLADPRKPEDFKRVLEPYGARLEPGLVEDPKRAAPRQANPSFLLSNEFCAGLHEIDRPLAGRIGLHLGLVRPILVEKLRAEGADRVLLLQGSEDAKIVPVEYREGTGEPDFVTAAKRASQGVALAVALRRPAAGGTEARIVLFGGFEVASPRVLELGTHYGNRDLVLNALNWLADRRSAMGIVEREVAPSRVDVTRDFESRFRWITLVLFPGILVAGAILVFLLRRN
jgi:hypothetical protein